MYRPTKLEQLTGYITHALKTDVLNNKIEAWQENGELILNGEDRGYGIRIAHWKYSAVINIENFPHYQLNPHYLLAALGCWLSEYDPSRSELELADPSIDIEPTNADTVDITISIDLAEAIEMIPDESGLINYKGENYHVRLVPVHYADDFELETNIDAQY